MAASFIPPAKRGDSEAGSLRESREGGVLLMASFVGLLSSLLKLYADSACVRPIFQDRLRRACQQPSVEIVRCAAAGSPCCRAAGS